MKNGCIFANTKHNNIMKKTINHNGIEVIDLESIRSAKYDDNIELLGEHSNTCFICGKRTWKNGWVHYTTDGYLVPKNLNDDQFDSQGFFPIGSECAKKIGSDFVSYLEDIRL